MTSTAVSSTMGGYDVNYHRCSGYNTQTGRLTESMFKDIFRVVGERFEA